jgi:hypothetical protein
MDSTIDSEILILVDILLGNVLRDYLVGDVTRTAAEVSSRPQVPPPELLLQMRKFCQQVVCRLPFQPLQPVRYGLRHRKRAPVHMIGIDEVSRRKGQVYLTVVYDLDT